MKTQNRIIRAIGGILLLAFLLGAGLVRPVQASEENPEAEKGSLGTVQISLNGVPVQAEIMGSIAAPSPISPGEDPVLHMQDAETEAGKVYTLLCTYYVWDHMVSPSVSDYGNHVFVMDVDGVYKLAFCSNISQSADRDAGHQTELYTGPYADAIKAMLLAVNRVPGYVELDGPLAGNAELAAIYDEIARDNRWDGTKNSPASTTQAHDRKTIRYAVAHIAASILINNDYGAAPEDMPDRSFFEAYAAKFQAWADRNQDILQQYRLFLGTAADAENYQKFLWVDGPYTGTLQLTKRSAMERVTNGNGMYALQGAVYGVYQDASCSQQVAEITTDTQGEGNQVELSAGTYYVLEKTASKGFQLDPDIHEVTITSGKTTALEVKEQPQKGGLQVEKRDTAWEKKQAEGDAGLQGAVFEIINKTGSLVTDQNGNTYADGTAILEITTDANGLAKTGTEALYLGTYLVREKKAPAGYLAKGTMETTVQVQKSGTLTAASSAIRNEIIKGGVAIQKLDADWKTEFDGKAEAMGDASLAGAEYAIYNRSKAPVINKDGKEIAVGDVVQIITTTADGLAQSGTRDLPYGTYEIKESKASPGYRLNSDWSKRFQIREDGRRVDLTEEVCYEKSIRGGLAIQKQDLETDLAQALAGGSLQGIRLEIINASAHPVLNAEGKRIEVGEVVQELTTDAEGKAATEKEALPYGTYRIREVPADDLKLSANDSYLLKGAKELTCIIREQGVITTKDAQGKELLFRNQIKRNHLELRKVDEEDVRIGKIPFVITQLETGEQHVIVCDENGNWDSHKYTATRATNANDGLLVYLTEGTSIPEKEMNSRAAVWFGLAQDQETKADPVDGLAPFPYGNYTLTELRCDANAGYTLLQDYPFSVTEDSSEDAGIGVVLNNLHDKRDVPIPGYTMEKKRVTKAPQHTASGQYGFHRGETVTYEAHITNTGKMDLTMDVTDGFADVAYFTDLRLVDARVDEENALQSRSGETTATVRVPQGKECIVTYEAMVSRNAPEYLAPTETDQKDNAMDGYTNTAYTTHVTGSYTDSEGKTRTVSSREFPEELGDKQDTANTPVQLVPGYTITKERKTSAWRKLAEKFGFFRGDTVTYEIQIANTGDMDLEMDVLDSFADSTYFSDIQFVDTRIGREEAVWSPLQGEAGIHIAVPAYETAVCTVTAKITEEAKEYLAPSAEDDKTNALDGYLNTVETRNVVGTYIDYTGKTRVVTEKDYPKELGSKKDTANTPVQEEEEPTPTATPTPSPSPVPVKGSTPAAGTTPGKAAVVQTGDSSGADLFFFLFLTSLTGITCVMLIRKREEMRRR